MISIDRLQISQPQGGLYKFIGTPKVTNFLFIKSILVHFWVLNSKIGIPKGVYNEISRFRILRKSYELIPKTALPKISYIPMLRYVTQCLDS